MNTKPTLLVLLGATGVGKTSVSLRLAKTFDAPIVSSDSRQLYRELKIGTAAPTAKQLSVAEHYFVGSHSIFDFYNAGQYELDVIDLLTQLFKKQRVVLLVGGSMMYIDAVCNGIDDIPTVDNKTREFWQKKYQENGLDYISEELKRLDPKHYHEQVDKNNPKRILHALEICTIAGRAFSEIRTGQRKTRDFNILKIGLARPREELYQRINTRVDKMMTEGLLEEARQFYPFRHLNTLNTVGYKELFEYFDGKISLETAVELIKRDSRHYAKKQISWFGRDKEIHWFCPEEEEKIMAFCRKKIFFTEKQ